MIGYSRGFRLLHWLMAVIIILMLSMSFFLDDLPYVYKEIAFTAHKSFGLTMLALMIIRLFWITKTGKPALPKMSIWERLLAKGVQHALYFFVIVMALAGWIMSVAANKVPHYFGLFYVNFPGIAPNKNLSGLMKQTHNTIAWVLIVLITLHLLGALKHHFINKDNVLKRMMSG